MNCSQLALERLEKIQKLISEKEAEEDFSAMKDLILEKAEIYMSEGCLEEAKGEF